MSHTVEWNQLKDGDIFEVPNPDHRSFASIGVWFPRDSLFVLKGKKLFNLSNPFVPISGYVYGPVPSIKSSMSPSVVVHKQEEIPGERYVASVSAKVNHSTGSDPEIFVVRGKTGQTLLPAFKYLPSQEAQQRKYAALQRRAAVGYIDNTLPAYSYRDGFAAECYIHPVHCHGYLINYLRKGLKSVAEAARGFDRTARLTIKNTFSIPAITMNNASDEDVALGCTPSLNAYDDNPQLPPTARDFRLRFAGGHVHFGMPRLTAEDAAEIVRACDVVAAIPAVAMFASLDTPVRRQFYGRAGEYRKPKHGLEYRVLSNAWLADPAVSHLVLCLVRAGLKVGKAKYRKYLGIDEQAAREIINFCDVKAARKYVTEHLSMFISLMGNDGIYRCKEVERGFQTIVEGGIEAVLPEFENVEKNWRLDEPWEGESNHGQATWKALCERQPVK